MIRLQHIVIQNYKRIRSINLAFPERASILIEGYNESGKSSLFEAIYFALYGSPLVAEDSGHGRGKIESVIRYNASHATVQLTLLIEDAQAHVERVINRTGITQAKLTLRFANGSTETIQGQTPVTQRLIQEMGNLTSDALLYSCFVEQKKLGKLEELGRQERQASLENLLNLSHLSALQRTFEMTTQDKQELLLAQRQLAIAKMDRHMPELDHHYDQLNRHLIIHQIIEQWNAIQTNRQQQNSLQQNMHALLQHREKIDNLRQERAHLAGLEASCRRLLPLVTRTMQLDELLAGHQASLKHIDELAASTLPFLQQRDQRLSDILDLLRQKEETNKNIARMEFKYAAIQQQRVTVAQLQKRIHEQEQKLQALHAEASVQDSETELAGDHYYRALEYQALEQWLAGDADFEYREKARGKQEELNEFLRQGRSQIAAQDQQLKSHALTRNLRVGMAGFALVLAIMLLFEHFAWGSAFFLAAIGASIAAMQTTRSMKNIQQQKIATESSVHAGENELQALGEREKIWQELGGDQRKKDEATTQLRNIGVKMPGSREEAQQRFEALPDNASQLRMLQDKMETAKRESDLKRQQIVVTEQYLAEQQHQLSDYQQNDAQSGERMAADESVALLREDLARIQQQLQEYGAEIPDSNGEIAQIHMEIANNHRDASLASQEIAKRQQIEEEYTREYAEREQLHQEAAVLWKQIGDNANHSSVDESTQLQSISLEAQLKGVQDRLGEIDAEIQNMQHLAYQEGAANTQIKQLQQEEADLLEEIALLVRSIGETIAPADERWNAQIADWTKNVSSDPASIREAMDEIRANRTSLRNQRYEMIADLGMPEDTVFDLDSCQQQAQHLEREQQIKEHAIVLISGVRERMLEKVLPKTVRNMNMLLPILTMDRYRECEITSDYRIRIFEEDAQRLVAKNVFSGGARDQFSLALRLAFALATLPEELGTTPGFIFLDEPLSSFDGPRSEALITLLTKGQIQENFNQIFVISHNQMFDRNTFSHHLRLEQGEVVESTLPGQMPVQ